MWQGFSKTKYDGSQFHNHIRRIIEKYKIEKRNEDFIFGVRQGTNLYIFSKALFKGIM